MSQLATATSHYGDDKLMVVQTGVNKQTTLSALLGNLNSFSDIKFNPNLNAIRAIFSSRNNENLLFIDGTSNKIGIGTSTLTSHILTIDGNISLGSSSSNGVLVSSSEEVYWNNGDTTKPISVARQASHLIVQSGFTGQFSLTNGFDGQIKTISLISASSGTTQVTLSGIGGEFTAINFTTKGDGAILVYKGSGSITGWTVVGMNGATLS